MLAPFDTYEALAPLVLVAPVLLFAAVSDLRRLRIPNWTSVVLVLTFLFSLVVWPMPDWMFRVGAAGLVFAAGLAFFATGKIGAGDVKLLSALVLLVPFETLPEFAYVLSACLFLGIGFIMSAKRAFADTGNWASLAMDRRFPMGISIAMAGILHPAIIYIVSL